MEGYTRKVTSGTEAHPLKLEAASRHLSVTRLVCPLSSSGVPPLFPLLFIAYPTNIRLDFFSSHPFPRSNKCCLHLP